MTANFRYNDVFTSGNITSSGIITGTSGAFKNLTINGSSVVRSVVAGTGMSVSSSGGIYTIDSIVATDSQQPNGFINRVDSVISMSGITFRIAPSDSFYDLYIRGTKVRKSGSESVTFANVTAQNYVYFRLSDYSLQYKTTDFDYSTDLPIAYVSWNSGVPPSGQATFFAEERHGIVMDNATHEWIHRTIGAQYVAGFSLDYYSTSGTGGLSGDATIGIGSGLLYQEDIKIDVTNSSSSLPFHQVISPTGQFPILYHSGTTGQWVKSTATNFPLLYNATGALYNLNTGGTWTTPNASTGGTKYIAMWMLGTNEIDNPVMMILGQRVDNNQGSAESNNNWVDLNFNNLPVNEFKPLYRFIYATDTGWTNTPKSALVSALDLRASAISSVVGVVQNDHGSLFGLNDDDHSQYIHNDISRTITAVHNFSNGITFNGSGTQTSAYVPTNVNITGGNISGVTTLNATSGVFNIVTIGTSVINNNITIGSGSLIANSGNISVIVGSGVPSQLNSNTGLLVYPSIVVSGYGAGVPGYIRCGSGNFTGSLTAGVGNITNLAVNSGSTSPGQRTNEVFTVYGNAGVSGNFVASGIAVASGNTSPRQRTNEVFTVYGNAGISGNFVASGITVASGNTSPIQRAGEAFSVFGSAGISGMLNASGITVYGTMGVSGLLTASGLNVTTNANANILTAASGASSPQQRRGEVFTVYGNAGVSGNLVASGITVASGNTSPIQAPNEVFTVFGGAGISGLLRTSNLIYTPVFNSPASIGVNQGDYNPGSGEIIRLSTSVSGVAISGMIPQAEYVRVLLNVGTSGNILLKHEAATATAAYRFITSTGGDYIMAPTGSATMIYDSVSSRWRVL